MSSASKRRSTPDKESQLRRLFAYMSRAVVPGVVESCMQIFTQGIHIGARVAEDQQSASGVALQMWTNSGLGVGLRLAHDSHPGLRILRKQIIGIEVPQGVLGLASSRPRWDTGELEQLVCAVKLQYAGRQASIVVERDDRSASGLALWVRCTDGCLLRVRVSDQGHHEVTFKLVRSTEASVIDLWVGPNVFSTPHLPRG
jgi:hypothetical protein